MNSKYFQQCNLNHEGKLTALTPASCTNAMSSGVNNPDSPTTYHVKDKLSEMCIRLQLQGISEYCLRGCLSDGSIHHALLPGASL